MTGSYPRVAIVTGATSGIGLATVKRFIHDGYGVVGNSRTASKLDDLETELGNGFAGVAGDASDESVINQLFEMAVNRFGRAADIVVVNAGRGLGGSVKTADLSELESLFKVNVTGALKLMQKAAQSMEKIQERHFPKTAADIVVIGSVVGRHVSPFSAVYGASKFALHSLVEALRREVGKSGVRVSLMEPGAILTGFQAGAGYSDEMVQGMKDNYGPLMEAKDVANAIQYIVSQPPHIHVSDMVVRPVRQDYP